MRLEIDQIAIPPAAEKMIEADFEQVGRRGVARDVAAELGVRTVGAHHHCERIPAHDRRDAALELEVAGKLRLIGKRHRVPVRGIEHRRQRHAPQARVIEQPAQEKGGALAPLGLDEGVERLQPFARFDGVGVGRIHAPGRRGDDVGEVGHGGMVALDGWPRRPCLVGRNRQREARR